MIHVACGDLLSRCMCVPSPWGLKSRFSWAAYIAGHPERLPRCEFVTWGDVPRAEYRRVTRNWQAWRKRRMR